MPGNSHADVSALAKLLETVPMRTFFMQQSIAGRLKIFSRFAQELWARLLHLYPAR